MSALTAKEQALYDAAKAALPSWLFVDDQAAQELIAALAKEMSTARDVVDEWVNNTYILQSSGFWLDELAKDRGTRRQAGETDAQLQYRLRNLQDLVTLPAITAVVNGILAPLGTTCAVAELRFGKGFGRTAAHIGTGSTQGAFCNRGRRVSGNPPKNTIVVILPYGTPAATVASIVEAVRQSKAGGITHLVETRGVP